jgi:glycosyltransferase involved in cell wall biosynthesis
MRKINVLWVVDHLGFDGILHGAGKYYLITIPYLTQNKFNTTLCVVRGRDHLTKYFEDAGINVKHLGRGKLDPRTLFDLLELIKSLDVQLIHTHGYGSDNYGRIVGKLLGIPTIIHAHDDNSNYPWHQNLADLLLVPFTKNAIAISQAVMESCITKRRVNKNKLTVLPNGILFDKFVSVSKEQIQKEKHRLGVDSAANIVGTVARLRKEKGIKYLLQAAPNVLSQFPNTYFLIAGDGPLRNELETLANQLGIQDKIIFAGFCDNIPLILSVINIFAAPSLTEGLGLGILEAMAMSKPIVASNVGGIKEILEDNKTGLLVRSEDSKILSEKIIYLLKHENEAAMLGKRAREASKNYDIKLCITKLEDFYLDILK